LNSRELGGDAIRILLDRSEAVKWREMVYLLTRCLRNHVDELIILVRKANQSLNSYDVDLPG
jgi:hypothetical protein